MRVLCRRKRIEYSRIKAVRKLLQVLYFDLNIVRALGQNVSNVKHISLNYYRPQYLGCMLGRDHIG